MDLFSQIFLSIFRFSHFKSELLFLFDNNDKDDNDDDDDKDHEDVDNLLEAIYLKYLQINDISIN